MAWTTRKKRFGGQAQVDLWRRVAIPRLSALADMNFKGAAEERDRLLAFPGAVPTAKWRAAFGQFMPKAAATQLADQIDGDQPIS